MGFDFLHIRILCGLTSTLITHRYCLRNWSNYFSESTASFKYMLIPPGLNFAFITYNSDVLNKKFPILYSANNGIAKQVDIVISKNQAP